MSGELRSLMTIEEMERRLSALQQQIKNTGIKVIIVFEGGSATGKGQAISSLILNFDPRGYNVYTTREPEKNEKRKPWLARFAEKMPACGRIAVFDRSWYSGLSQFKGNRKNPAYMAEQLNDITMFERQLTDDGYHIVKFLFQTSKKEQKKLLKKLMSDKDTIWRVNKRDLGYLKHYRSVSAFYRKIIGATDRPRSKWHIVDSTNRKHVKRVVLQTVMDTLEAAVQQAETNAAEPAASLGEPFLNARYSLLPSKPIQEYDLSGEMDRGKYNLRLKELQKELRRLHNVLYAKQIPVVMAFEGNDAAGKGGSIKRVARALDPRGYTVIPVGAPSPEELRHHYLWRFWERLPKTGHIAIFDRTWYGRVLVERVERFTSAYRINQAYNEINEFEYMLYEWGAIVLKFWMVIDKDVQLERFEARQDIPEKRWKITDEDWRNREKWNDYTEAVNDMLRYTNTDFAPWHVIESNCKLSARIKTLAVITDAINSRV